MSGPASEGPPAAGPPSAPAASSQASDTPPAGPLTASVCPKEPKRRSRMGCMTCRKRKHKCGEERVGPPDKPSCARCLSSGYDCVWPTKEQLPQGRKPRPYKPSPSASRAKRGPSSAPSSSTVADAAQQHSYETLFPTPPPSTHFSPSLCSGAALPATAGAQPFWPTNAAAGPSTFPLSPSTLFESFLGSDARASPADTARVWDLDVADGTLADLDRPFDASAAPGGAASTAWSNDGTLCHGSTWLSDPSLPQFASGSPGPMPSGLPPEEALQQFIASPYAPARSFPDQPFDNDSHANAPDWALNPPRYVTPTPALEILYSNPEERSLIQHFLFQTPVIFVGRPPSSRSTFQLPDAFLPNEQPDLRSFLPYLDVPHFLSLPRGFSTGADALAMAIMSSSAIHLAHLHHMLGLRAVISGDDAAAARAAAGETKYAAVGRSMAKASQSLVRASLDLAQLGIGSGNDRSDETTRLLVACSFSILTDCISGGNAYKAGLDLAKEVVASTGGARQMLASLASSVAKTDASPLAATGRRRLRLLRSCLEELLSWELVTTLSTGTAPSDFAAPVGQDSLSDWFYAFSPPSGSRDMSGVDWETVETTWGTSRPLMELFARVNSICAAARTDPSPEPTRTTAAEALVEIRIRKGDLLRAFPELARSPFPPYEHALILEEAEDYRRRIKYGKLGACDDISFFEQRRAKRLEFGDLLWCLTFEIMLRVDVLGEPSESPEIRSIALRIVELVRESHVRMHVQVGLAWPTVIAGSVLSDEESRSKVRAALETFRAYCLYELDQGAAVLNDLWALRDAGDTQTTWREVAGEKGFALV